MAGRVPLHAPKIIGFCGYPGSGKDEAAKVLVARGWQRIAFADKLRNAARGANPIVIVDVAEIEAVGLCIPTALNRGAYRCDGHVFIRLAVLVDLVGWDRAKKAADVRRFLQRLGTEGVRDNLGVNSWVDAAERQIEVGRRVVFTDVRFANEVAMIRSRGGLICRVWRESSIAKFADSKHVSEEYMFGVDASITNDGTTEELANKVLELAGYSL